MHRDRPDPHERLASPFESHELGRRIRDVPPHEVYEVRVDGRRAVYKADTAPTGNAAVEGRVTRFVGRETSVPVPEVLDVGDDYYVAAWHPDAPAPDAARDATEGWARAAGRGLATLHDETASSLDRYGRFRPDGGRPAGWRVDGHDDWHAAAVAFVRGRRPVLDRYGRADVADAVERLLRDRPDAFDGAGPPVCCHGWATPEHVAVADGRVRCVVDFEHALAAPGEWDYWRTVLPTFAGGGDGDDAREAFRAGYESVRPLPSGFDRRAGFYALLNEVYYFESLFVQNRHDARETAERARSMRERVFDRVDRLGRRD